MNKKTLTIIIISVAALAFLSCGGIVFLISLLPPSPETTEKKDTVKEQTYKEPSDSNWMTAKSDDKKREPVEANKEPTQLDIIAKKEALQRKYDKLFCNSGDIIDKQSKLLENDFKQISSGYEPAPDGSTQIAMHYAKEIDGYVVLVSLQYSYSLSHHYCDVYVN